MDLMSQWQQSEMFSQGLNPQEDVRNIEDENPIFKTTRVDFEPPHEICSLVTSNNTLIMGFTNSHIIRLNLTDAEELEGQYWLIMKIQTNIKKIIFSHILRALRCTHIMYDN